MDNTPLWNGLPLPATIQATTMDLPWTTGTNAAPGGVLQCQVDATPATFALVFASLGVRRPFVDGVGEFWTDPAATVVLTIGVTDAQGALPVSTSLPSFVPRGLQLTFQSLLAPSSGQLTASAPAVLMAW